MKSEEKKSSDKKVSPFIRFSTLGIQMGVIISFFTWLGVYLDEEFKSKAPWFTLILSLFGVCSSLILVIKEVMNMSRNDK
jgi:F0F1-type ATP synthase assembly protein I